MTSGQKIAFSLLTAMILFAGFFVVSQSGLLTELETRYYSQAKIREKVDSLDNISENLDSYITNFLNNTKTDKEEKVAFLNSPAVISYVDANNPSEEYISERRRLTESLFTEYPALKGFRIIDKNGRNVHYSSFDSTDILRQTGITKYYKFYQDIIKDADELEIASIAVNEDTMAERILVDSGKKRVIVSMPLKLRGIFQASVVFYFDIHQIQEDFVNSEILSLGQNLSAFSDGAQVEGFAVNVPVKYYEDFSAPILESWKSPKAKFDGELLTQPEKILEIDDGRFWVLLTSSTSKYFKVSGVYTSDIFELSKEVKYLIYITVAISLFLIAFLCFSFKTDKKVVIKKRIKKIQYSIISEYLDNKEKIEWSMVVNQLKARKDDLSAEILKSAGVKSKKKAEKLKLDEFLEQSWEQIFAVIAPEVQEKKVENKFVPSTPSNTVGGITLDQLRSVIEEVLQDTKLNVQVSEVAVKKASKKVVAPVEEIEEVEELDEDLEEVEEIDEVEELTDDIEEIDEVEELDDDVEDVEEVEELADDVEEVEEIDEVDEVEELADDVEEVEEVEELADDVEEVEEVEELADDVEELADDIEEVEEVEEVADDVEEVEEVEELEDDVEEVDEVEELADDIEDVEEIDEVEEVEELDEVEQIPQTQEPDPLALVKALSGGPQYKYRAANDTFIHGEKFPTVDNLFAEELATGPEYVRKSQNSEVIELTASSYSYKPKKAAAPVVEEIVDNSEVLAGELEELDDSEMFITNDYFAMTQFGANTNNIQDLESATDSIYENEEGLFEVADDLEYSEVTVDENFKNLVEKVTK